MLFQFNRTTSESNDSLHPIRLAILVAACLGVFASSSLGAQTRVLQQAVPMHQQSDHGVGGFASNTFKAEFDAEIQRHFDRNKIPGMVVLMARDGMLTYRNTKGFADVENRIPVSENHVFRIASISKWVGALMALKLEEQGQINLGARADSLLTNLPDHHTSRVIDFLTCRAGIRHYGEPTSSQSPSGWSSTVFSSATDAVPSMWHDPLVNPGSSHYSTHSYTFLGACMEQATGRSTPKLVASLLRRPYNLSTLRAEDLNDNAVNRVKLYGRINSEDPNSGNQRVNPDNLTWKFLGGGLESSGIHLLQLGMKVCDKQVISHNNLERMLTRIEPNSGYNLGCNTGVENGNRILAKDGGQTGASSYIWMAPDKRMVMVILTNIRQGKASSLGKKLRGIALGTTSAGNDKPDLIVKSFSKTGTPYYQGGKLKIPFELQIKNQGKGGTPESFANAIRLGSNYRWTRFMQTLPPNGQQTVTGVIKINDPSKLQQGRTLSFVAKADAPIVGGDTSIHPDARVFESSEGNNERVLRVKIPGGIGGFEVVQPERDSGMKPQGTPTRTNPKSGTRTNPTGAKRSNPKPPTKTAPAPKTGKKKSSKKKKKGKRSNGSKGKRTNPKKPKIDKSKGETASKKKR